MQILVCGKMCISKIHFQSASEFETQNLYINEKLVLLFSGYYFSKTVCNLLYNYSLIGDEVTLTVAFIF